jgi:hypothetical protein
MGILSWFARGKRDRESEARVDARVTDALARIIRLDPQLRLVEKYEARMGVVLATCIGYVESLVMALPEPRGASAQAWSSDPFIHAFFATPGDVASVLSRSAELRACFEQNPDLAHVHAVLSMAMYERRVLGVAWVGEHARPDVAQTTVSFNDHRIRICARTDGELREEIVLRAVDQLVLNGMQGVANDASKREVLEEERALLKARLQLLERQGAGMRAMIGSDEAPDVGEVARLQARIEENSQNLASLGLPMDLLDRKFEHVRVVLAALEAHLHVEVKRLRLDRMNVVMEPTSTQPGDEIEFRLARIPGSSPETRTFSLVRVARTDLLPERTMLHQAARLI